MATMPNTNINIPYSAFIEPTTGRPTEAWLLWLMSPNFITVNIGSALPVTSGGTGLSTIPTNGQLLIGNGTGYTLNTLGTGAGISVTNGLGTITVANTGVLSNIAGAGISVSSATGNVTIANTGVLSWAGGTTGLTPAAATTGAVTLAGTLIAANGGTGFASYAVGDLLYADTTTTLAKLPDVATGNALISGGVITAPAWGKIGLTTHVSGILPIANGGTNATTTPTAGAVAYGTGTAYGFTAAGTAGQVLTSNGAGVPTWTTNAGGDVTGPASSTDNAIARFDGTTGKLIQNSVTTIDDTGNASGILSQQFSNGSAVTLAAGKMWYDGSTGAWNLGMGNGNITQQVGEEIFVYGKASAAITDSPLQIIYHTGVVGASGVIQFAPTVAGITDANAIIGVATESLALNGFGRATVFGVVRGITTNGTAFGEVWADDDVIWYNPVTGNPTKVEPVAPYIKVQVGLVIKAGAGGSGSFQVGIARGSKLGGTDSNVQFGTLANTDLIQYSTSLGYWTNVTPASVINASSGAPVTKTANFTVAASENWLINNKTGSTCTVTLPTASSWTGRVLRFLNYQAQTVVSASSNVVPLAGGAAGTSILLASTGDSATLVSDGSNWLMTQYIPNNILLLE